VFEKNGYDFIRNDKKNDVYRERDFIVIKVFQNLVNQRDIQFNNAVKLVIDRFGKGAFETRTGIVRDEQEKEIT